MNVFDNIKFIERVEYLKRWYKAKPSDIDEISGMVDGYLDCLVDLGLINTMDTCDIALAVTDYITGFKSELSPYED